MNKFPLNAPQKARKKIVCYQIHLAHFCFIHELYVNILYEVCIADYARLYILGHTIFLGALGLLSTQNAPREAVELNDESL